MTNPADDDEVSYLDVQEKHKLAMPVGEETVWARIGDNLQLEYINWELINMFAAQFDELTKSGKDKTESHVMCKLITLVRDVVKEEALARFRAEQANAKT